MLVKNLSMNLVNSSDTFRTDHRQFKIADRLLRAIAQHELELAYQPEMDLLSQSNLARGALSLAR